MGAKPWRPLSSTAGLRSRLKGRVSSRSRHPPIQWSWTRSPCMDSKPGRKPPDKEKAIRLMAEAWDAVDRKGDRRANACPRCNRVVVFVLDLEGKDTLVLHVDRDEDVC